MSRYHAIQFTLLAQYHLALGNSQKAKDAADQSLKALNYMIDKSNASEFQDLLNYVVSTYDKVKLGVLPDKNTQIEFLSSKIGSCLLLPWPPLENEFDHLNEYGTASLKYIDELNPSSDMDCRYSRVSELPEILAVNKRLVFDCPDETITQAALGDCSVVATLVSINELRRRNNRDILLHRIHPQVDKKPVLSPSGHYVLKLPIGGTERIVDIDDRVPVCCFDGSMPRYVQTSKGSLWPSIVEKAYLKAMGGYDFEGSHAAIDTFNLTGWIPSYISLPNFHVHTRGRDLDEYFDSLHRTWKLGLTILCVGTGQEPPTGLVPNHDYAIVEMKTNPNRVKVVNPWGATRGQEFPVETWYDWPTLFHTFEMLYINEDPSQFKFSVNDHSLVSVSSLDHTMYQPFPQYVIESSGPLNSLAVVAVVKPMGDTAPELYISLRAYDSRHRLITDTSVPLVSRTTETNSLCTTLYLDNLDSSSVLVVVTLRDVKTSLPSTALTLMVYSSKQVSLTRAPVNGQLTKLESTFGSETAGGNYLSPTYAKNPQFLLTVPANVPWLDIYMFAHSGSPAQIALFWPDKDSAQIRLSRPQGHNALGTSGKYHSGGRILALHQIVAGSYILIPSLFEPSVEPFTILANSTEKITISPLVSELAGLFEREFTGRWAPGQRLITLLVRTDTPISDARLIAKSNDYGATMNINYGGFRQGPVSTALEQTVDFEREIRVTLTRQAPTSAAGYSLTVFSATPVTIASAV